MSNPLLSLDLTIPPLQARLLTLLCAIVVLALATFADRDKASQGLGIPARPETWSLRRLLLVSFLTLFAELAVIRWIAVEVRVFAYFKNLALLLCFAGFGFGCALANKKTRWLSGVVALIGLIFVVRLPIGGGTVFERLSEDLGAATDMQIWATSGVSSWLRFLSAGVVAFAIFALVAYIFLPLGQTVSKQMDSAPNRLAAYSWNLVGSLAGILIFLFACRFMLSPAVWMSLVLMGFALLQVSAKHRWIVAIFIVPMLLQLHEPLRSKTQVTWTPYQQIRYLRLQDKGGDFFQGRVSVNNTAYQTMVDLSSTYLARHPELLKEAPEDNPYNLPFRFAKLSPSVLIVGAGTGNDAAAAVRHQSRSVDAVEIDPFILELGRREHPERPYSSPNVAVHLGDARSFLKRTQKRYDLILFGLLDSHTQLSDYSNMRLDNFVYTEESFQEARRLLNPMGIMFVKFQVNQDWMAGRLAGMLRRTFGKEPLVFYADSSYSVPASCFAISPGTQLEEALSKDTQLSQFVMRNKVALPSSAVEPTTDDWPYLYQQKRGIPRTYYPVTLLVMILAIALFLEIEDARRSPPSLFFFAMGAGFLLLETQVISRLSLFFGTTWEVNGIVISSLLMAALLATFLVNRNPRLIPNTVAWCGLALGLAFAYWLPVNEIASPVVQGLASTVIFSIPIFFAGVLFASEFKAAKSPSAALASNMLGAVAGGLLENTSLVVGMRALLVLTVVLYCMAAIGQFRKRAPASLASFAGN